jgi:hypothetical protein
MKKTHVFSHTLLTIIFNAYDKVFIASFGQVLLGLILAKKVLPTYLHYFFLEG